MKNSEYVENYARLRKASEPVEYAVLDALKRKFGIFRRFGYRMDGSYNCDLRADLRVEVKDQRRAISNVAIEVESRNGAPGGDLFKSNADYWAFAILTNGEPEAFMVPMPQLRAKVWHRTSVPGGNCQLSQVVSIPIDELRECEGVVNLGPIDLDNGGNPFDEE